MPEQLGQSTKATRNGPVHGLRFIPQVDSAAFSSVLQLRDLEAVKRASTAGRGFWPAEEGKWQAHRSFKAIRQEEPLDTSVP